MAMRRAAFAVRRPHDSAKLDPPARIVAGGDRANGRKVVVFSYFRDVLDGGRRGARRPTPAGRSPARPPVADRQRIVDEFTAATKPAVLVCQIEAGGVGARTSRPPRW